MRDSATAATKALAGVTLSGRMWYAGWFERLAVWSLISLAAVVPFAHTGPIRSALLACAIVGWLGRWYSDATFRWIRTPVDVPMALYVAWAFVGLVTAVDIAYSAREVKNELVTQAVLFVMAASLARRERDAMVLTRVLAVAGFVMGAYAVWQFDWHFTQSLLYTLRWNRSSSFTSDPIFLSSYLVLVLPIVLFLALSEQRRWARVTASVVFGVLLLAVVSSGTRAAWVALISQGLVYGILRSRRALIAIAVLVSLLIGLLITSPAFQDWTTDGYRLLLWRELLPKVLETPLTGYGFGPETPPRVLSSVYDKISFDRNHTFNTFFNVALEVGLVGLALFVFLLWRLGVSLWQALRQTSDPSMQFFFLCTLMVLVGFMTRNQLDHMLRESPGHLFWILMGLGVGRAVSVTTRTDPVP